MKPLFFDALEPSPRVAAAVMRQTRRALRPFNNYLRQAIDAARKRQTRYRLPWERVVDLRTIRLERVDTRLRVPRVARTVLRGWPPAREFELAQLGFITNRGVPVRFEGARPCAEGLAVTTDTPLVAGDEVLWCRLPCEVSVEAGPPPAAVFTRDGRALTLTAAPTQDDTGRYWLLVVEGIVGDGPLVVDGEAVYAEALLVGEQPRRVVDAEGRSYTAVGDTVRAEGSLAEGMVTDDEGLRYRWRPAERARRAGCWVRLLVPESSPEDFVDPRAAFIEGETREVWTSPRRSPETTFSVRGVDPERYQLLLDRWPPEGSTLFLPVDVHSLSLQQRALRQLTEAPLQHHRGLLRLCEQSQAVRWPDAAQVSVADADWRELTDPSRSGTDEQRRFVLKALASPDFALLEGPPGSGKTTAICELVQQLVRRHERVLLCASTHVAIDNVLERLLGSGAPIDAVRVGHIDRVDDNVRQVQLDRRVEAMMAAWAREPGLKARGDAELRAMAERSVVMAANLTCGTTTGIAGHPLFRGRDEDLKRWERPIASMPHWDVLIIDEASKTLIHEFMVPALMAKRWVVVGDVRQLPPFTDREEVTANLRDLVDEHDRPLFPPDHQRACLLLFRLLRAQARQRGARWVVVERPGVLRWLAEELAKRAATGLTVVSVTAAATSTVGPVEPLTLDEMRRGAPRALLAAAADWVLVPDELLAEAAPWLPGDLLHTKDVFGDGRALRDDDPLRARQAWQLENARPLERPYEDRGARRSVATLVEMQSAEQRWLERNDLAQEITWRVTRRHELRRSRDERERERLSGEVSALMPAAVSIQEAVAEIEDIGLPSILEVLQEGIGEARSNANALSTGLRGAGPAFARRFERLSFQHRMHPEIAAFPRDVIYAGEALRDANTLAERDAQTGWDFGTFRGRRAWAHVDGREQSGVNADEVRAMAGALREFSAWARRKGPPPRGRPALWEVACLCFYAKQERAVAEMLREITGDDRATRFRVSDAPVEIVCATVDRFQGREADMVLLSMRNTARVGFLNSPNRLNVAVTRARQQLVVFGNVDYFGRCRVSELEALAERTPRVSDSTVHAWRRER